MENLEDLRQAWERATAALLQAMPEDYDKLTNMLTNVDGNFRKAIANRLEPAFNKEAASRDREGFGWRKKLAAWANEEAAHFGLAIQSPTAECGSMLCAESGRYREGRFFLQHRSASVEDGIERTDSFDSLPHLSLYPTLLEQPAWDRWTWKVDVTRKKNQGRGDR